MDANERRERASAEAADWWLLLKSNDITRAEREQYVVWLRESAMHVSEMLRVARLHKTLAKLNCWDEINTDDNDDGNIVELAGPVPQPLERRPWIQWALAASLVAMATAAVFAGYLKHSDVSSVIETQRGERREVALSDGSFVQLDPQTKVRIAFDAEARSVELQEGRALFRVSKGSSRPFSVRTGETIVRALGTAFAVDRRQRGVTVTVAEGKVAVMKRDSLGEEISAKAVRLFSREPAAEAPAAQEQGTSPRDAVKRQQVILTANEQVTFENPNLEAAVRKIDSTRELAWTQGRLIFQNTSVVDAIEEFNRYNHTRLRVADASAATYPVNGVFDATDTESFVAFLQTVARVNVIREEDPDQVSNSTR